MALPAWGRIWPWAELREKKKKKEENNRFSPHFLACKGTSFQVIWAESWAISLSCCVHDYHAVQIQVKVRRKILGSSLPPYWSFIKIFPIHLLFFFVFCSECLVVISGRENAGCLFHLVGARNLATHLEHTWNPYFLVCASLGLTGSGPLIEPVFGDPISSGLVVPGLRNL